MNIELVFFIILASIAIVTSIFVITRPNAVMSAVFLVLNFFALAGLYLLLNAQFISVVQVIVYAGAIMVLFLFVIMLLRTDKEPNIFSNKKSIKYFAILISAFVFIQIVYLLIVGSPSKNISPDSSLSIESGTIQTIGRELYTNYIIPFEAAGFLLLAATIGAVILAKKKFE